jgi:hypothetical protein
MRFFRTASAVPSYQEVPLGADDDDRAAGGQVFEAELAVIARGGDTGTGIAPHLDGLSFFAAHLLEQLADGQPKLHLVNPRTVAVARDAEQFRPRRFGRP